VINEEAKLVVNGSAMHTPERKTVVICLLFFNENREWHTGTDNRSAYSIACEL
jgi:hypothetical protein